jgi:hypothetical protein
VLQVHMKTLHLQNPDILWLLWCPTMQASSCRSAPLTKLYHVINILNTSDNWVHQTNNAKTTRRWAVDHSPAALEAA